jgi:hypothetical protein
MHRKERIFQELRVTREKEGQHCDQDNGCHHSFEEAEGAAQEAVRPCHEHSPTELDEEVTQEDDSQPSSSINNNVTEYFEVRCGRKVVPKDWDHLEVQMTGHHKASEKSQQTGHLSNHTPDEAANQGCSQDRMFMGCLRGVSCSAQGGSVVRCVKGMEHGPVNLNATDN